MKALALGVGLALLLICGAMSPSLGAEARLVRYPHYHNGRIVFTASSAGRAFANAKQTDA